MLLIVLMLPSSVSLLVQQEILRSGYDVLQLSDSDYDNTWKIGQRGEPNLDEKNILKTTSSKNNTDLVNNTTLGITKSVHKKIIHKFKLKVHEVPKFSQVEVQIADDYLDFEDEDPFFEKTETITKNSTFVHHPVFKTLSNPAPSSPKFISVGKGTVHEIPSVSHPADESTIEKLWNFFGGLFSNGTGDQKSMIIEKTENRTQKSVPMHIKDLSKHAAELYRSYHPIIKKHFVHSYRKLVEFQRKHGYIFQRSTGKIISKSRYDRKQDQLDKQCPYLVEVKNLISNQATQYLTISSEEEREVTEKANWKSYASVGYCVNQTGMCGANQELVAMWRHENGRDDFDYVANERDKIELESMGFKKKSTLCFIWSLDEASS